MLVALSPCEGGKRGGSQSRGSGFRTSGSTCIGPPSGPPAPTDSSGQAHMPFVRSTGLSTPMGLAPPIIPVIMQPMLPPVFPPPLQAVFLLIMMPLPWQVLPQLPRPIVSPLLPVGPPRAPLPILPPMPPQSLLRFMLPAPTPPGVDPVAPALGSGVQRLCTRDEDIAPSFLRLE